MTCRPEWGELLLPRSARTLHGRPPTAPLGAPEARSITAFLFLLFPRRRIRERPRSNPCCVPRVVRDVRGKTAFMWFLHALLPP